MLTQLTGNKQVRGEYHSVYYSRDAISHLCGTFFYEKGENIFNGEAKNAQKDALKRRYDATGRRRECRDGGN